jgi:type I restriction enzyme S subunit
MTDPIRRQGTPLGDIALVDSGPAFQSKFFGAPGEGIPLLRGDNIAPGRLRWTRTRTWPRERLNGFESMLVEPGDIILAMDRPIVSAGLKLARATANDVPALLVQRVARIRVTKAEPSYVHCMLQAPAFSTHLVSDQVGTQLPHITLRGIKDFRLPLPSLADQRQIVEILEDHLSRLEVAEVGLTTTQRRLEALHKSVLLNLVPDIPDYPAEWQTSTVGQAGKVDLGRQRHPDWHVGPNMKPYLRVANVFEDRVDTTSVYEMHWPGDKFDRFRLIQGDVLLNEGQTPELLGRPALYRGHPAEVAFTNSLLRFQANEGVLPEFALLVFRRHMHAGRFTRESRITTNIAHLSAARLKPIEFPIPPLHVQHELVNRADEQLSALTQLRTETAAAAARSAGLRRALLGAAFSGRLTR